MKNVTEIEKKTRASHAPSVELGRRSGQFQATPRAKTKPLVESLTFFLKILLMNVGFLGIQHGFSIQFAKMSSIYEQLGASADQIPMLWLAAPMTGLLVQPVIGYFSDRTWCALGRRRPYFLVGAILATLALFLMPNAGSLWMAAGLLWVLDASINISMEPYRAFIADRLPEGQRGAGFAIQTVMIGVGGWLGFQIAAIDWLAQFPMLKAYAPTSLHMQFYLCGLIYLAAVLLTVVTTPEDPPAEMPVAGMAHASKPGFVAELLDCFRRMPQVMKKLALVQFFTWMGLFCMWMFYAPAVAHHVFHIEDPHAPAYANAINQAGGSMGWYQLSSTLVALLIAVALLRFKNINRALLHTIGLTCAGVSLLALWFVQDPQWLVWPMLGVGVGWATILSMPYDILSRVVPQEQRGLYMGIFNMFIVLPEILTSLGLGWVLKNIFHNQYMPAITMGGVFMLIAAFLAQSLQNGESSSQRGRARSHRN